MTKINKFTKTIAFVLSAVMVFAMTSITAFADISTTDKGTITVSGVAASDSTVDVTAYRIIKVDYDYTANQPNDPEFFWEDSVKTVLLANNTYKNLVEADGSASEAELTNLKANSENVAEFYDFLASEIAKGNITIPSDVTYTRKGNGTISADMGNYLVIVSNGMKVYRPSAVNVVPEYDKLAKTWKISDAQVELKSSDAGIQKKVVVGTEQADNSQTAIGSTVKFEVKADVPVFPTNATTKKFVISDDFSAGLTFNSTSIAVYGIKSDDNSEVALTKDTEYTVADKRIDGATTADFVLDFDYSKISNYKQIVVTYTATLNGDAVIGNAGNLNTAHLEYSNNPYDGSTYKSYDDTAKVYTYGFDLTKVAKGTNTVLTGAQFTLSKNTDGTTDAIKFVKTATGEYRVATADDADTTTTLEATDGTVKIAGLGLGKYYLKETKAPEEYNVQKEPFELSIQDTNDDFVAEGADGTAYADGFVKVSIENGKGFELPKTGGMGTVLFTVGGIALVVLGAAMIVIIRKRSKREAE